MIQKIQNVIVYLPNVAVDEKEGKSNDEDDRTDKNTDEDNISSDKYGSRRRQGMFALVDEDEIWDIKFGRETVCLSLIILLQPCPLDLFCQTI